MSENVQDLFYVNGINGSTGRYIEPPLTADEIAAIAEQMMKSLPESDEADVTRRVAHADHTWATVFEVDARDLAQAGWGVIFSSGANPALRAALQPLLDHRKEQAGDLYREYSDDDGYLPGDSWQSFRARHRVGSGLADPKEMPYYLLIIGSPQVIPFAFQYNMDLERAAGRIYFSDTEAYARYAQNVVDAEQGRVRHPRRAVFFATSNPDDSATRLSSRELAAPMAAELTAELSTLPGAQRWQIELVAPESANKSHLSRLLGGGETPAFLFTATHGMGFNIDDPRQLRQQGALVTQDWPGPLMWQGPLNESDHYFSAEDVAGSAQVRGMIAFLFACYGAGTPALNDFIHRREQHITERRDIAKDAFMSFLPQRLLSHPNGGALAVIGHIDRAWSTSFQQLGAGDRDIGAMKRLVKMILLSYPVGYALEELNSLYAQASVDLNAQLFPVLYQGVTPTQKRKLEISRLWTATHDARNYLVIGDPAVRLPLETNKVS